jgi:hypothetical protein
MKKANLMVVAVMVCFAFIALSFIPVSAEPQHNKNKPVQTINLPRTGQTYSEKPGDDGDLQMGVEWPVPRFTDNGNGTVTDNLTRLVWLRNADCFGIATWIEALSHSNTLQAGLCGLSDNSLQGDWRLPNRNEMLSLIDINYPGDAFPVGHPFFNVRQDYYWTSSTATYNYAASAWRVSGNDGSVIPDSKNNNMINFAWPVRSEDCDHVKKSRK